MHLVAIASSKDKELGSLSAPLDAELNYEQVNAVVRRGLDLDSSQNNLKNTIKENDWVVIKPNIVTSRSNPKCSYWYQGIPHSGQVTDLRVIKSIVGYIIDNCRPRRITIAEGGAEWRRRNPEHPEDGWNVHWPEFDNLSFEDIVEGYNKEHPRLVDIVDLNYDRIRFCPVPDPKNSGIGALQRFGAKGRSAGSFGREAYAPDTGTLREGYYIPETILMCDKLISVPAMKTHTCGTTLTMKNYIGILPSHPSGVVRKGDIHHGDTQKGFIDLFSYHPADYSVIEGFWSTEGNGPQWGDNIRHNVVIASADPVAADAVGSAVMGFNPKDLDYLYYAAQKGFGTFDLNNIEIIGNSIESVLRKFKRAFGRMGVGFATRGNRTWLVKNCSNAEGKIFESQERYIDLARHFNGEDVNSATAYVNVYSAIPQKGKLWASADGKMKVELNETQVLSKETETSHRFAEFQIDIELKKGNNPLTVYLEKSPNGFGFTALLCNELGDGLFDIEYSVNP
ncbi:DUF362 domain-containing protein [Candidatus Poribacteria bacterium]|nr:DUF362 domain-containing protein [Candidatus Poribacteria bacterium]